MDSDTKRALTQAKGKGTSVWLIVLPIEEHGLTLIKNKFRDAVHLCLNKMLKGMSIELRKSRFHNNET